MYTYTEGLKIRGLPCQKRDSSRFLKIIIQDLVNYLVIPTDEDRKFGFTGFLLFPDHPYLHQRKKRIIENIGKYLHDKAYSLVSGLVPIEDLAKTKKLKNEYEKDTDVSVVAKKMSAKGYPIDTNTKLKIVKINIKRNRKNEEWDELSEVQGFKLKNTTRLFLLFGTSLYYCSQSINYS